MIYQIIRRWLPLAFLATALCGLVYVAVQQSLRQGGYDPQIQMAEDAAAQLSQSPVDIPSSSSLANIIPSGTVDISTSLAPYLVVYDGSGNPVAGNGMLDGSLPGLPAGVFASVAVHGEDRFTWQPRPDVREAVVVVPVVTTSPNSFNGFIMAARSLREVEVRTESVGLESLAVWLFSLVGLLILEIIFAKVTSKTTKERR